MLSRSRVPKKVSNPMIHNDMPHGVMQLIQNEYLEKNPRVFQEYFKSRVPYTAEGLRAFGRFMGFLGLAEDSEEYATLKLRLEMESRARISVYGFDPIPVFYVWTEHTYEFEMEMPEHVSFLGKRKKIDVDTADIDFSDSAKRICPSTFVHRCEELITLGKRQKDSEPESTDSDQSATKRPRQE
jgi:hypothetical protein